jgi:hypothetical protein
MAIRVACLLPKRNNGQFYSHAFNSLAAQVTPYCEILVCENHSVDGSENLPFILAERTDNAFVFRPQEPANSIGESLLELIKRRPDADYYHIASSDDIWHPEFVTQLCAALAMHPGNVSAVFCDRLIINNRGRVIGASGNLSLPTHIPQEMALSRFLGGISSIWHGALFRSDVIANAESFSAMTGNVIDWAIWLEAARLGDMIYLCKPLFSFRSHSTSTGTSPDPEKSIYPYLVHSNLLEAYRRTHRSSKSVMPHSRPARYNSNNFWPYLKYLAHLLGIFPLTRKLAGHSKR